MSQNASISHFVEHAAIFVGGLKHNDIHVIALTHSYSRRINLSDIQIRQEV